MVFYAQDKYWVLLFSLFVETLINDGGFPTHVHAYMVCPPESYLGGLFVTLDLCLCGAGGGRCTAR